MFSKFPSLRSEIFLDTLKQYWYHIFLTFTFQVIVKNHDLIQCHGNLHNVVKTNWMTKMETKKHGIGSYEFFFLTSSIIQAFCVVSKSRRGYIMCITRAYVVNSSIKWFRWTSAHVRNVFDPRDFRWHCSWTHFFALELFFQWLKWQDKDSN